MTNVQRLQFLDNIIADATRLDMLLLRLRELAQGELSLAEGRTSLDDILNLLRTRFPVVDINGSGKMEIPFALPLEVAGIVFANLAENAVQHGATRLDLTATFDDRKVTISFRDNGHGNSAANREHVFQPFFSTRREHGGTGMGLGIVRAMLGEHGGKIDLGDCSDGTHFVLEVTAHRR